MEYTSKQISESRKQALDKIREILDKGNPDELFSDNNGDYYSKDRFLLVWKGNYKGMPSEMRIDKTDAFYANYSGYKAIYASVGLFHEKQLKGYSSIERAFIDVGLDLCRTKKDKRGFYEKYTIPYNNKIKEQKPVKS
jgi:hypothetical protein